MQSEGLTLTMELEMVWLESFLSPKALMLKAPILRERVSCKREATPRSASKRVFMASSCRREGSTEGATLAPPGGSWALRSLPFHFRANRKHSWCFDMTLSKQGEKESRPGTMLVVA